MSSGVTFGQLPEEEAAFLAYLQKTGDVWARAVNDDPHEPKYQPLPVAEFLDRFADQIARYHVVDVYLGLADEIHRPKFSSHEVTEGGTLVPFVESLKGFKDQQRMKIVGGTKVMRDFIDPMRSPFVRYHRGQYHSELELASSNLSFSSGGLQDQVWIPKPPDFLNWGKNILAWMRRHTPESVPVYRCNYKSRATIGVAEACKNGLKLSV